MLSAVVVMIVCCAIAFILGLWLRLLSQRRELQLRMRTPKPHVGYRDQAQSSTDNVEAELEERPPYSYGRLACPKCGRWRFGPFDAYGRKQHWLIAEKAIFRQCGGCNFEWLVRGKDGL